MGSSKLKDLKAYVRYDGSGRVVSGSLIFRKKKPKNGRWVEIAKSLCCNDNPVPHPSTTTTTTTNNVVSYSFYVSYWFNLTASCSTTVQGYMTVYSASPTLQPGSFAFTNPQLTTVPPAGYILNTGMTYPRLIVLSGGYLEARTC